MSSKILIAIRDIKYAGDNLGDDFKISFKLGNLSQSISPELKYNGVQSVQEVVWSLPREDFPDNAMLQIKALEDDPLFDDSGKAEVSAILPMDQTVSIRVQGRGRGEKNKSAVLEVAIVIKEEESTRYVYNVSEEGWLTALNANRQRIKIPYMLKVDFEKREGGREYFEISEGVLKGKKASVIFDEEKGSYLTPFAQHKAGVSLVFDRVAKTLSVPGVGVVTALTEQDPIPEGVYSIEIPDHMHKNDIDYSGFTKFFHTWFLVEKNHSRYLHAGQRSEGCVTVSDLNRWDAIYQLLIVSRLSDGIVGQIEVR